MPAPARCTPSGDGRLYTRVRVGRGPKMEDIPKTWDAFYVFFKEVQKKLREQGVRHLHSLGFQVTTNGV